MRWWTSKGNEGAHLLSSVNSTQRMQIEQFVSISSFWQMPQASPIMLSLVVEVLKSFKRVLKGLE
jgi:hypothetical protein